MLKALFGKKNEPAKVDQRESGELRIGDSVRVNAGIVDEDFGLDLIGWQGRVTEVDIKNSLVLIAWDSVTLRKLPKKYISDCEEGGYGWDTYYLRMTDVVLSDMQDIEEDAEVSRNELQAQFAWHHLGAVGREISRILDGIERDDEFEMFERWEEYFSATLTFPFKAEVTESQGRGPLRSGDILTVHGVESVEEMYGLIVKVKKERKTYYFPLCDLTPIDEKSSNYQPVRNYAIWFANH